MPEIRYYVATDGQEPFADWFADLEAVARAKATRAYRPVGARQLLQCEVDW
jgi:hypothetical protein